MLLAALGLTLTGCDSDSSTPAVPTPATGTTSAALRPTSVAQVFALDGDPQARATLAAWARDVEVEPALRVAALRRLEELGAPETVLVAADLAREPPGLVRDSAVATLVRLKADEVIAALDPATQALAHALAAGAK